MARRSDHSREEIREMALEAAEQIVSADAFRGLSARKVAAAIGYTVGTLYLVFENFHDLILQVNGRTLDRLHREMREALSGSTTARESMLRLGATYIRFADENPHHWGMVFEHRLPEGQQAPDWYREKVGRMFMLVERSMQPLAGAGAEREIAQAARALWSGIHGICILAQTGNLGGAGVESVQALADSLISNYLDGFTHRHLP